MKKPFFFYVFKAVFTIQKVESHDLIVEESKITQADFVLGIRPEFININPKGKFEGEIYSSMPTGMETTAKIKIGRFLITGVFFGNINYKIDEKLRFDLSTDRINLFSRLNQKLITTGKII